MQIFLDKLQRELKYRNYSSKTIEVYSTCLKYFFSNALKKYGIVKKNMGERSATSEPHRSC